MPVGRLLSPLRLRPWSAARPALVSLLGLSALAACSEPTVAVKVVFPSEETFLHAAVARIDVYDGSGTGERSPDAICRSLSVNPPAPPTGVSPLSTSGNSDPCAFRDGGVQLDGIGVGRRVIFVEAQDFDGQSILRGCTVVDIYGDTEDLSGDDAVIASGLGAVEVVEVSLAILPDFPQSAPGCDDVDAKCGEEPVSCRPAS